MLSLRSHSSTAKGLFKLSQEVVGMGYHKLPSLPVHWIYYCYIFCLINAVSYGLGKIRGLALPQRWPFEKGVN